MPRGKQAYDMNIPDTEKARVVVIGAGFWGINLVKRLDENLFQIIWLDRYNYHAFQLLLYLVVATGSSVNFFENPSIAKHAYAVDQITQAHDIRSDIFQQLEFLSLLKDRDRQKAYLNFVVVGAGPTGVEIFGALAELKNKVLQSDYRDIGDTFLPLGM